MTSVFGLPDWVPWWVQLLLLIVAILFFLALFLMPFSVFGLKSRLESVEIRLDEIQADIRSIALRLAEPPRRPVFDDEPPKAKPAQMPPAPPQAAWTPDGTPRRPIGAGLQQAGRQEPSLTRPRAEPRIDRFR